MATLLRFPCPECGHYNATGAGECSICSAPLGADARQRAAPVTHEWRRPASPPREESPLLYLGIGLLLAPVFTFTPLLQYMGWFLSSLVHEMGHAGVAWAAACPAFPAIRLDGHAAAVHSQQVTMLAFVFWGLLAYLAFQARDDKGRLILYGALALLYPIFAFTGLREFCFLLAGHAGELTFAGIFFYRAIVGGWTPSRAERAAYATVSIYLIGHNVWLSGGLLFSEKVRVWYRGSGSFGLTNDYLRLARQVLGVDLGVVAFFMLAISLAVPVAVWLFASASLRDKTA